MLTNIVSEFPFDSTLKAIILVTRLILWLAIAGTIMYFCWYYSMSENYRRKDSAESWASDWIPAQCIRSSC